MLGALAVCYATGLAVINLSTAERTAHLIDVIFPHIGQGNRVDTASVSAAWDVVRQEYVFRDVDASKATQGAESGIIDYLHNTSAFADRFSAFYTAPQYEELQRDLSGRRNGSIGIALEGRCGGAALCASGVKPSLVAVEDVLHGQPAEKAGLRSSDVLTRVDGRDITGLSSDIDERIKKVADLIRGSAGTSVTLTVQRGDQTQQFTVTRANLQIPSVFAQRFAGALYLQVTGFDQGTSDAFHKSLHDGLAAGATAVILDLRHNPGGLVSEAQGVASEFLVAGKGQNDVVVRRGRLSAGGDPGSAQRVERDSIKPGGIDTDKPLVVLIDGDSASAAEIVAAALNDYQRATLIGQKTFGKGSVQQDFPLPDGSDLHLTVEKWFGPKGETIDGSGITPGRTVAVADDDHRFRLDSQGPDAGADAQLQAALGAVGG